MARGTQRLPAAAIPEHRLITTMGIDVVDDAGWSDQVMTRAFHTQRMIVQERGAFRSPSILAIERAGQRITLAGIVLVTLALVAPANRAMDRRTHGHGADLDDADDDGAGNDNAREGSSPSRARYSPEHSQNYS